MDELHQQSKSRPAMEDLLFGLFLAALAVLVFAATRKLMVGSAADMGPGYFPQATFVNDGFRRFLHRQTVRRSRRQNSAAALARADSDPRRGRTVRLCW